MTEGPLATYRARQRADEIAFDPMQDLAAEKLQSLHNALAHYQPSTGRAGWKERLGRGLVVPLAARGVARFSFADLCAAPLGAGDYLEIARRFHTLVVDAVPRMGPERRNEAPGGRRRGGIPAHGLAADRDAIAGLHHDAARDLMGRLAVLARPPQMRVGNARPPGLADSTRFFREITTWLATRSR